MVSVPFLSSCGDDDDVIYDNGTSVSGNYVGTLTPIGYSDAPARTYVTLERLSTDAVRVSRLVCEEFGLDLQAVNLVLSSSSDGRIILNSETSKAISGTYYSGQLTLTFMVDNDTFYFSGTRQ